MWGAGRVGVGATTFPHLHSFTRETEAFDERVDVCRGNGERSNRASSSERSDFMNRGGERVYVVSSLESRSCGCRRTRLASSLVTWGHEYAVFSANEVIVHRPVP